MELQDFCTRLVAALNRSSDATIRNHLISNARQGSGSGKNYGSLRWVSVPLSTNVGPGIASVNIMPYRLDMDLDSGNFHYLSGEIQLVGCTETSSPKGPSAQSTNDRLTLYPARYWPRLDEKKSASPGLTWAGCFDGEQLSAVFIEHFHSFMNQLKTEQSANPAMA